MGNRKRDGLEKTQRERTDNIFMFYLKLGETQKRIKANIFNNNDEGRDWMRKRRPVETGEATD